MKNKATSLIKYVKLYELIAKLYNHILLNTVEGEKALAYLESRKITRDTIKKLNIGYSYKGNILRHLLNTHGYNLEIGKEYGLFKQFEKEPKYRDFFYGRIMFPIRNEYGQILAFAGRTLPHNTHPAKYLNTPETSYFCKGEVIYNLDMAKKSIKEKDAAILLEGYFDTAIAAQSGLLNVISLMGTTLTEAQVVKLRKLTNRVILCLDGDKAGYESAKRNSELLLAWGFEVRIAVIPEGRDPHEFIVEHGIERFIQQVIKNALPYLQFIKEYTKFNKNLTNEIDQLQYVNEVLQFLNSVPATKEQGMYFKDLAQDVGISIDFFRQAIRTKLNNFL